MAVATTARNTTRHTRTARIRGRCSTRDGGEVATTSAPLTVLPGESATRALASRSGSAPVESRESDAVHVVTTLTDEEGAVFDEDRTDFGIRRLQLDPSGASASTARSSSCAAHACTMTAGRSGPHDRRCRGSSGATAQGGRVQRHPQRPQPDQPRHPGCVRPSRRARHGRAHRRVDAVEDRLRLVADLPRPLAADVAALVAKDCNHPSVVLYRSATRSSNWPPRSARPGRAGWPRASASWMTRGSSRTGSTASIANMNGCPRRWPRSRRRIPTR